MKKDKIIAIVERESYVMIYYDSITSRDNVRYSEVNTKDYKHLTKFKSKYNGYKVFLDLENIVCEATKYYTGDLLYVDGLILAKGENYVIFANITDNIMADVRILPIDDTLKLNYIRKNVEYLMNYI